MSELVRAVTQCGHLVGDTIVQASATSHMVPVEKADGEFVCTSSNLHHLYTVHETWAYVIV